MYATALHVKRRSPALTGVNTYLYTHGDEGLDWQQPDHKIVQDVPGRLVASWTTVPPGSNEVRSFLDIVGPDQTPIDDVRTLLTDLESMIDGSSSKPVCRRESLQARFSVSLGLQRLPSMRAEFTRLARHLVAMLDRRAGFTSTIGNLLVPQAPLRVLVTKDEFGTIFQLDPPSMQRLTEFNPGLASARVGIRDDTREYFESLHGPIFREVALLLTGLNDEQLHTVGGIVFEEAGSDAPMWSSST